MKLSPTLRVFCPASESFLFLCLLSSFLESYPKLKTMNVSSPFAIDKFRPSCKLVHATWQNSAPCVKSKLVSYLIGKVMKNLGIGWIYLVHTILEGYNLRFLNFFDVLSDLTMAVKDK